MPTNMLCSQKWAQPALLVTWEPLVHVLITTYDDQPTACITTASTYQCASLPACLPSAQTLIL